MRELPVLQDVANQFRDRGVELVTVLVNGTRVDAQPWIARLGVTAPVLVGGRALMRPFRVDAVPWTVVVGRDGRAQVALRGRHGGEELAQVVEKALN